MGSIRCKLTGCDLDACGTCRRCGDASAARHAWQDLERDRPCYRQMKCKHCEQVKESPDHDWTPAPTDSPDGTGVELSCSRCDLKI